MNRAVYHATFHTRAVPHDPQPDHVRVHGEATHSWMHDAIGSPQHYETDATFTGELTFAERGTLHFDGDDTLHVSTQHDGLLTAAWPRDAGTQPSPGVDGIRGAVIWHIDGGSGRLRHAAGLITANVVFDPTTGDGIEEQLGIVFVPDP